jgi:uncharacterized protein
MRLLILFIFTTLNLHAQETTITEPITDSTAVAVSFPEAIGYVNDFEGLFTEEQVKELEKIISDFKAKSGNEIVVASVSSIQPYEKFDEYALDLSRHWKVGSAEEDNGLTLIFSKTLRQIRISTGTGTETRFTNEECKKIIDEFIIPEFKKGYFYEGVKIGLKELITRW